MSSAVRIKSVYKADFQEEMVFIKKSVVSTHPFVSFTTKMLFYDKRIPSTAFAGDPDFNYARIIRVVSAFKLMQVGVALCNEAGDLPCCPETGQPCAWEFNLKLGDNDSLQLQGLRADKFSKEGIHGFNFWFVLNHILHETEHVRCVVFKGGLDFGSLMKLEPSNMLPGDREQFLSCVRRSYPPFYDVMHLAALLGVRADGTVEGVAAAVGGVAREGEVPPYGAASDSVLVLRLFMKMKQELFGGAVVSAHGNKLFGLTT